MAVSQGPKLGRVVLIARYPVKSMLGEELNATEVSERGLLGDRAFALVDVQTGKVASAKEPRKWPNLFDFRAAFIEPPRQGSSLPAVRITFPDGESVISNQADVDGRLSAGVGRSVRLTCQAVPGATAEGYWPDDDWLPQRNQVFDFQLPPGMFFDGAPIHLVTTATLDRLRSLAPAQRFEVPRFRPSFVIESPDGAGGFVENDWVGKTIAIGEVRLRTEAPCPRCVMTTLPQGSLPKDPAVLRTAVQQNSGNVGVYATVVRGGSVRRGDGVELN
jgi:uncharacterized protein YcbX